MPKGAGTYGSKKGRPSKGKANAKKINDQLKANRKLKESKGKLGKQHTALTAFGGRQQHYQGKAFPRYTSQETLNTSIYTPGGGKVKLPGRVKGETLGLGVASGRLRYGKNLKETADAIALKAKRAKNRKRAKSSLAEEYG